MKRYVWGAILAAVAVGSIHGAPVVMTSTAGGRVEWSQETSGAITVVRLDWLTDTPTSVSLEVALPHIYGEIARVVTKPDDGATSPTEGYTMSLLDVDGADLFAGRGASRHATAAQQFAPMVGDGVSSRSVIVYGENRLKIDSAGAAVGGTVRLTILGR